MEYVFVVYKYQEDTESSLNTKTEKILQGVFSSKEKAEKAIASLSQKYQLCPDKADGWYYVDSSNTLGILGYLEIEKIELDKLRF